MLAKKKLCRYIFLLKLFIHACYLQVSPLIWNIFVIDCSVVNKSYRENICTLKHLHTD